MFRPLAIALAMSAVSLPASAGALDHLLKNHVQVQQSGSNLSASVNQSGQGHRALIDQRGTGHSAAITQTGRSNTFLLTQRGQGATANVQQSGTRQFEYLFQHKGESGVVYERRW